MDACKKDKDGDVVGLEGFTGKSGFTGDMFTFRQNENQKSASAGNVVFKATKTTSGMSPHGSYAEAAASGADEVLNGGCAMPIYGPTFTETWDEHNCSTKLSVYSPVVSVPNPVKWVNSSHGYYDGDVCDWMITQGLNVLYRDIYMPYTQMVFRDTFDANLTITGVDVYKDSVAAANRLGTGNYTYSLSGQTVTVTMSPSYLANTSIYNGGSIILVVHTKVKANGLNKATIPNTGSVTLSGVSCNTNTVAIRPWYRVYVTHEGSGSTDPAEKKEQIEWNASQKVTYAPSKDWYTKEMYYGSQKGYTDSGKGGLTHVGGSDLKVNSKLTQYTFTGINEDKHLRAVFVPIPELTVQKVISGDRKSYDTFGSPLFYYQIRGTDYLGDTHTWYWNIQNEGRVTRKVPAGDYTVTELPVSRYSLKAVDNIKNFTGLSVNDRKGTCNLKDGLPTDRPGDSAGDGYIKFTNELTDWEDYSHNSQAENRLK